MTAREPLGIGQKEFAIACYHLRHPRMADETFQEFHLDGKQMVFLFMASTVVAVVIFLCGVMVGRGVRTTKNSEAVQAVASVPADSTETASAAADESAPSDAAAAPEPPELTYPKRLGSPTTPSETLRDADARPREAAPPVDEEPAHPTRKTESPVATAGATSGPAGGTWMVQVLSATRRAEADAVAKRLAAKGYPSSVDPTAEAKPHFRVRVGKYRTRKEALAVAARLERAEKFRKPWVIDH